MSWTPPTFDREPIDTRHGRGWRPKFLWLGKPRSLVESSRPTPESVGLGDPCWTGYCKKCGRPLISATTPLNVRPDHFECGICE